MLLRELGGIGLMSVDADDVDNVCGKGGSSLLNTIGNTVRTVEIKITFCYCNLSKIVWQNMYSLLCYVIANNTVCYN